MSQDGSRRVSGMVLSAMPVGETDKRVVLLTREEGLISAFVRGGRRQGSSMLAASTPFAFGVFDVYIGRSSVTVHSARIDSYFTEVREDIDLVWFGTYFLEVAEYFALEGVDETDRLNLLYVTLLALGKKVLDPDLVRWIYELRTWAVSGEYPNVYSCTNCGEDGELLYFSHAAGGCVCKDCHDHGFDSEPISGSCLYAMQYIIASPLSKLYSFKLKEEVRQELIDKLKRWRSRYVSHRFKSEEFLKFAGKGE